MISSISIRGLFDKFNYQITFNKGEITILTGPNGFGKTTILKMKLFSFHLLSIYDFVDIYFRIISHLILILYHFSALLVHILDSFILTSSLFTPISIEYFDPNSHYSLHHFLPFGLSWA